MNIYSVLSTLLAGFISAITVHFLGRSKDEETWTRDSQKAEWRELFTALGKAELALISKIAATESLNMENNKSVEGLFVATAEASSSFMEAGRLLLDRIFIADAVRELKLSVRWSDAMEKLENGANRADAIKELNAIRSAVAAKAIKQTSTSLINDIKALAKGED